MPTRKDSEYGCMCSREMHRRQRNVTGAVCRNHLATGGKTDCEIGNIEEICMDGMTLRISRGSYQQRADTEDEPSDRADAAHAMPSRTVCNADREMQDKRFHSKDRGVTEGIEESGSFEESSRHVRSEDSEMLTRGSLYNPFLRAPLHPVRPQCNSRVLQRLHRGTEPLVPHAQRRFPIAGCPVRD